MTLSVQAATSIVFSSFPKAPTICRPRGMPSADQQEGRLMAGTPWNVLGKPYIRICFITTTLKRFDKIGGARGEKGSRRGCG